MDVSIYLAVKYADLQLKLWLSTFFLVFLVCKCEQELKPLCSQDKPSPIVDSN